MPAVAPFLLAAGQMINSNVQNKAAIKNQENAQASAQSNVAHNQQNAIQNLQQFQQQHQGPASAQGAPRFDSAGSIPMIGGQPQGAGGIQHLPPGVAEALMAHLAQNGQNGLA